MGSQQSTPSPSCASDTKKDEDALATGLDRMDIADEKNTQSKGTREPQGLTVHLTQSWQADILKDPKNRLAVMAISNSDPYKVLLSPAARANIPNTFNVRVPVEGIPIGNQHKSGRCWLFASTHIFRLALMRTYRLDSLLLSQEYLSFWDKLEKANWVLEQVIATAGEELDSRLVQCLLESGRLFFDGGQWDMVYNLVSKYGLVPHDLYPDSRNAENPDAANSLLLTKIRECALELRGLCADAGVSAVRLSAAKDRMMREVLRMMTVLFGPPPNPETEFAWDYVDRDGKARSLTTTPLAFSRDIYGGSNNRNVAPVIASMMSLVHDPRHPPLTHLTVDRLGNVVGGRSPAYANVDMPTLKAACLAMLRAGHPVFFGCDSSPFTDKASGIMDPDSFDYEVGLGEGLMRMSKADRLNTGQSKMDHAMVLTGVHVDDEGGTVRWRVMNSYGPEAGRGGYRIMTDRWMDEWVYQAVVDPRFVGAVVRGILEKEPVVLPLWDPMGSLA